MRIHLQIKASNLSIPFDHQPLLVGTIHKWLGKNEEHGKTSLYSFSWLTNGKRNKEGILFENNSSFFISSFSDDFLKRIIDGIRNDPSMFYNLTVNEIIIQENPNLNDRTKFFNGSPIFIKRTLDRNEKHIRFTNPKSDLFLKETLLTKLKIAGIEDSNFEIAFDRSYLNAGTKKINYDGIDNITNWCPIILKGSNEIKTFAWNVGIGNSTGIGFGAIK